MAAPIPTISIRMPNKTKTKLSPIIPIENDETQDERDKYVRLLRYVILKDGSNFNKMMIREGLAKEYTYKTPYKYQKELH